MQHDEEYRRYARTDRGAIIEITESHSGASKLPDGAVEITEAAWETEHAEWETALREHVAQLEDGDRARHEATYAALRALGLPESVARALSGLRGAPVGPW